jgi:error-prone DNA polymerase
MRLAVVAADYTPGEADQLRRDMAAWRRSGRMEQHRERLVSRMRKKGIALEFAERVFQQIQGFGEYGFPESHAASFALISYAGSWLKCHEPAVFACALLNAQPMGFYSIATIVDDAVRHSIEVRPVDALTSAWDCTLEPKERDLAIRMGLRTVKRLGQADWKRIERARANGPIASIEEFRKRSQLDERALTALAEAGAFEGLASERRSALWTTLGVARSKEASLFELDERAVEFERLSRYQEICWDYERTSHSTRGHVLAPLRAELTRKRLPDAASVRTLKHGARARYAGMVICRQHPATASGVTFMTLEDETGFVNVVLWKQVFDRYALLAKTASFLGVAGKIQEQDGVVHLVADKLWTPKLEVDVPEIASRDFH